MDFFIFNSIKEELFDTFVLKITIPLQNITIEKCV